MSSSIRNCYNICSVLTVKVGMNSNGNNSDNNIVLINLEHSAVLPGSKTVKRVIVALF